MNLDPTESIRKKDKKLYTLGELISSGAYGAVYKCANDPTKVIKVEPVGLRRVQQILIEIKA